MCTRLTQNFELLQSDLRLVGTHFFSFSTDFADCRKSPLSAWGYLASRLLDFVNVLTVSYYCSIGKRLEFRAKLCATKGLVTHLERVPLPGLHVRNLKLLLLLQLEDSEEEKMVLWSSTLNTLLCVVNSRLSAMYQLVTLCLSKMCVY